MQASVTDIVVPSSREEVIELAGRTLGEQIRRATPKKAFKKQKSGGPKLAVEIAVADQSPESVAGACQQLLQTLGDVRHRCTLLFHDIDTALKASDKLEDADVVSVEDFNPAAGTGVLVVVGVPDDEEETVSRVLKWRGAAVVWLSFETNSLVTAMPSSRRQFDTVFAFEPFATRGFLLTTEGLIFKQLVAGKTSPWLIYKKSWGNYKLVGKTQARPKSSDIEMSFYNDSAAESPIVKGIKAIKSVANRK